MGQTAGFAVGQSLSDSLLVALLPVTWFGPLEAWMVSLALINMKAGYDNTKPFTR